MQDYIKALEDARSCEQQIGLQLEHIERLRRIARRTRESDYNDKEYSVRICEKLAALEKELNEQVDLAVDAKRKALVYLSVLEGEEYSVIYGYYMLAKRWQSLADELYMSERRVYLLRKKAFDTLERHFGKESGKKWA